MISQRGKLAWWVDWGVLEEPRRSRRRPTHTNSSPPVRCAVQEPGSWRLRHWMDTDEEAGMDPIQKPSDRRQAGGRQDPLSGTGRVDHQDRDGDRQGGHRMT